MTRRTAPADPPADAQGEGDQLPAADAQAEAEGADFAILDGPDESEGDSALILDQLDEAAQLEADGIPGTPSSEVERIVTEERRNPSALTPDQADALAEEEAAAGPSSLAPGDSWAIPRTATMVVYPNGAAVSARGNVNVTAPGTYRALKSDGTEVATVEVVDQAADDVDNY